MTGDFESMGRVIASNLYFSFFTDEDNNLNKGIKDTIIESEANYYDRFRTDNYENLVADVENRNLSFSDTLPYLTIQENGKYVIEFDWLLSLLFGVVFLYLMFTYCIQVATRVIQLAYLQLIAPVPILSYISDPDGAFQKWLKQCATTFLDLFIRLAIIYFIMAIIDDVISQFKQASGIIFDSTGIPTDDHGLLVIVKIFIILGLLMFAKRVPELLKDLFPNFGGGAASLGFGLKNPKKMLDDIPGLKGAATFGLGAAAGGIAGMASGIKNGYGVRGKIAGAFGGFNRGIAGGAKTKGNIFKNVQGGMSSTRQARQRALDKQMYKIDNSKLNKEYQDNEAIVAAKKAIDDRAESELLKTDTGVQAAQARLNYIETNVGKVDAVTGRTITTADVVAQKATYKAYMDSDKETWVNTNASNDKDIAKQMQIIQNKTGKTISNYNSVSTAATTAKNENKTNARKITNDEYNKEKMQQKKSKIK